MGEPVFEVFDPVVQRVGRGDLVFEIHCGERVADVVCVDVVLKVVQLGLDEGHVVLHDGQHLVELAKVSLGEVEHVETVADLVLGNELQHGVAPMEVGFDIVGILPLDPVERQTVLIELFQQLGDGISLLALA